MLIASDVKTMNVFDIVGIGFGPGNLALAIALEELFPHATARFLEAHDGPSWQSGMLLDGADIQNHPARDLVTLRNPRSRYSFLNYLFEHGRLIEHLNLPVEFPLRKEYAQYIFWVAGCFAHLVDYGQRVSDIRIVPHPTTQAPIYLVTTAQGMQFGARVLVVGTGRTPYIPQLFAPLLGEQVFHAIHYLDRLPSLAARGMLKNVAVIGGSQSAIEITLDLAHRYRECRVVNYVRGFGYRLKDTSPFSEESYFPQFIDYYYNASAESKRDLDAYLHHTNYSSADKDVIHELYLLLYEQKLDASTRVQVQANRVVTQAAARGAGVHLGIEEVHTHAQEEDIFDAVILATGFRDLGSGIQQELYPAILEGIVPHILRDSNGVVAVNRDYSLTPAPAAQLPPLYLNGLCESSHGVGDAGSFSLLSLRAQVLCDSIKQCLV